MDRPNQSTNTGRIRDAAGVQVIRALAIGFRERLEVQLEGGFLEDVLKRIATVTEHQEEMKSKVIGALVYPMFLVVVGTAVVSILIVFFVPKFAGTFDAMLTRLLGRKDEAGEALWKLSREPGVKRIDLERLDRAAVGSIARDMLALRLIGDPRGDGIDRRAVGQEPLQRPQFERQALGKRCAE